MPVLYIFCVVLILFLAVIFFNACRCKADDSKMPHKAEKLELDIEAVQKHFSEMIKCKTVSNKDKTLVDEREFEKFRSLLADLYPVVHEKCEKFEIAGGLLFKIKGRKSENPAVLMAHFDVVSVNSEKWDVDPFSGKIKDGFLWGRGTLDTKCSLFGIMESAEALVSKGFVPENDVYLSFGCNEEIAGDCAPAIVNFLKEKNVCPAFVLDEGGMIYSLGFSAFPYNLAAIGIAEKGPMDVELCVKGESGHASRPPKHTAAGELARDIRKIENHQFPMKIGRPVKEMIKAIAPYTPFYAKLVLANLWCFAPVLKLVCKKNNTAAAFLRTSIAFTQLSASKGANVLPMEAKAVANVRLAQGTTSAQAVSRMKKATGDSKLEIRIVNVSEASPCAEPSGKYWDAMKSAVEQNFENTKVAPFLMVGGTDSRFFNEITDNVFKFAPVCCGNGLLSTVHSDNERIRLDNIPGLINFYFELISNL